MILGSSGAYTDPTGPSEFLRSGLRRYGCRRGYPVPPTCTLSHCHAQQLLGFLLFGIATCRVPQILAFCRVRNRDLSRPADLDFWAGSESRPVASRRSWLFFGFGIATCRVPD